MTADHHPLHRQLLKGLEEEVYTGTPDGHVLPLSTHVKAALQGYTTEPDGRNVEFTTAPYRNYQVLVDRLMAKRCALRRYLDAKHGCTLVPGGALALADPDSFYISDPENPYYRYIRDTYGTRVVTASTHINLGIDDPEELLRAYRVLRLEASVFLALTAASPFLAGNTTGQHSARWLRFPLTPERVPFFPDAASFATWMDEQVKTGAMQNRRHLWLGIRPNGPVTPRVLDRLELRICDRISEPDILQAVTALFEARVWQVLERPELDPLRGRSSRELEELAAANERAAGTASLEAQGTNWVDGSTVTFRDWAASMLEGVRETAHRHDFGSLLGPIEHILEQGNPAMKWLRRIDQGATPREVISEAIVELAAIDRAFDPSCPLVA